VNEIQRKLTSFIRLSTGHVTSIRNIHEILSLLNDIKCSGELHGMMDMFGISACTLP
jgi:hypothetical protein